MSIFVIDNIKYDSANNIMIKDYNYEMKNKEIYSHSIKKVPITGIYFIMTNTCNLNCVYCFAKKDRKKDFLLLNTAKPLIYEIVKNALLYRALGKHEITPYIKFSGGGEPTLNIKTMKEIVDFTNILVKSNQLPVEYHLATNGQWYDSELNDWINKNITNLLFSIDGIESVNNIHRPRIDKNNSYNFLIHNLKSITNPHIIITFRMTVSNYSLEYLDKSITTFRNLGIKNIQIEPLMPFEIKKNIFEPNAEIFAKHYIEVKYKYKDVNIFSSFDVFNNETYYACGHQLGNIVSLFPNGIISSCPERSSNNEIEYIRGIVEENKAQLIDNYNPNFGVKFDWCKDCIVNYKCSGLCPSKVKLFDEKDYKKEYLCEIYRNIFVEHLKHIINEKKIKECRSCVYDINASKFVYIEKSEEIK